MLKRITIITSTFIPEYGAAPLRLGDLAYFLASQEIKTDVITGYPFYPRNYVLEPFQSKSWKFSKEEPQKNLQIFRLPVYPSHSHRLRMRLLTMLSLGISMIIFLPFYLWKYKTDVVFVQSPPPLFLFHAFCIAKLKGIPLIMNISDLWSEAFPSLNVSRGVFILRKWETFFLRQADAFVVQSEEIQKWLDERISKKAPILLHRTGVQTEKFIPKKDYKICSPLRIVYAGVLGIAHGLADLCKNMNFSDIGAELHLYGNGADRSRIEEILKTEPFKGIFLWNDVQPHQIPSLLVQYDAALISQKTYLLGTVPAKLYEAFAAGLPILFVGEGEGEKLVTQHEAGFCAKSTDYQQLRKNILELSALSEKEREKMGKNGRLSAELYYDRKKLLPQLFHFLSNIVLKHKAR